MIEIREDQMQQLWMADREDFIVRLQKDVIKETPWIAQIWPPVLIHRCVSYALDRATIANGFTTDIDVQIFVSLMFSIGPDFDQHLQIHKVLSDASIPSDKRWDILTNNPDYAAAWQEMNKPDHCNWSAEGCGRIHEAYPTTYMLPGFIALYNKIRKQDYPFLSPGESLGDDDIDDDDE